MSENDLFRTPTIASPYPEDFESVTEFVYKSHLYIGRKRNKVRRKSDSEVHYVTLRDYDVSFKVDGKPVDLKVPAGMLTDLASVPSLARPFLGRVGPHLEASIVHDFLFIAWQLLPDGRAKEKEWRFANEVMYAALRRTDMKSWKQWSIRRALNNFSWGIYRDKEPNKDQLFLDPARDSLFDELHAPVGGGQGPQPRGSPEDRPLRPSPDPGTVSEPLTS